MQVKELQQSAAHFIPNAFWPGKERYLSLYGGRNKLWGITALIPNNECILFRQKIVRMRALRCFELCFCDDNSKVCVSKRKLHDYTWDVIIATIGGTMEFWIGAGLLSIVQLLVFMFDNVSDGND